MITDKKYNNPLIRIEIIHDINSVFELLHSGNRKERELEYNGYFVKKFSVRYQTFEKSISCVRCGIIGTFFALEKNRVPINGEKENKAHFNLYGFDKNGEEVIMTKDHIVPQSKGGADKVYNMQTMCWHCNQEKRNNIE